MLSASQIRIHGRDEDTRRRLVSALWNAGALTLAVVTTVLVLYGVLAMRAS